MTENFKSEIRLAEGEFDLSEKETCTNSRKISKSPGYKKDDDLQDK